MTRIVLVLALCLSCVWACPSFAQWQRDGVPVCTEASTQLSPVLVPDGSSGALVFWTDLRSGIHIYGQHIDAAGNALWAPNGVEISAAGSSQEDPVAMSDGLGGAIIAYEQFVGTGPTQIIAQRVNSNGVTQWTPGGEAIGAPGDSVQYSPAIISDNKHGIMVGQTPGAIIAWIAKLTGQTDANLQIEAIDNTGAVRWPAKAVETIGNVTEFSMTTDGVGIASAPKGAILTWTIGSSGETRIWAQRITSAGGYAWGLEVPTVGIQDTTLLQAGPVIASSGAGNAIVEWSDIRNPSRDVFGQRFVGGNPAWGRNGLSVSVAAGDQEELSMVSDGVGGAISVWRDRRFQASPFWDIFAQRVSDTGVPVWTLDGVPVSLSLGAYKELPVAVPDFSSGAIIVWGDNRLGNMDLFAQHLDASGTPVWSSDGIPVCAAPNDQSEIRAISDDLGGAIVAWTDRRTGSADIYAQHIAPDGSVVAALPAAPTAFQALPPFPNPMMETTTLRFVLPTPGRVRADVFSVEGRLVRNLMEAKDLPAGIQTVDWDGRGTNGERLPSGLYLFSVRKGNGISREKVLIVGQTRR